jgi:hypothetical protein
MLLGSAEGGRYGFGTVHFFGLEEMLVADFSLQNQQKRIGLGVENAAVELLREISDRLTAFALNPLVLGPIILTCRNSPSGPSPRIRG